MLLGIGDVTSATAGEASLTHTARTTAKGKAITPRNASSCAESLKDTMANSKITCKRGDAGQTQPDAEEGAVQTAKFPTPLLFNTILIPNSIDFFAIPSRRLPT